MIQKEIEKLIKAALASCIADGIISADTEDEFEISTPKQKEHGDFATNAALILAAKEKKSPRDIAKAIVEHMPESTKGLVSAEIAGPGFINFTVKPHWYLDGLRQIYTKGINFGRLDFGKGKKVQVEFVSANPTGPLHIGHGRGAVYGDTLANVLSWAGFDVTKEYYVNDTGNQIKTLGKSVYLRIRELQGENVQMPEDCYKGHYLIDIARQIKHAHKDKLKAMDEASATDFCGKTAGSIILESIKQDLADTGVVHDTYFFESKLHEDELVKKTMDWLKGKGHIYEKDGATWFNSSRFGDDKDRVLRKSDGSLTYFAADIAYHKDKYDRGFKRVIDVWGADHAGYVGRMKACIAALVNDAESFEAVLIQLVNLVRGGQTISMSTRGGTFETLEDVRNEVGRDACRYFFLLRSHNAQLDFDLDLAKKESADNPVFYIQYAHARIASIFKKAGEQGLAPSSPDDVDLSLLSLPEEAKLARMLGAMPGVIQECAQALEPHKLAFYLLELARMFQAYYSKGRADERYKVLSAEPALAGAKLYLLKNVQIVLQNALRILGISAPDRMAREEEDLDA
ncbi:MAG: arginine--tRNA ligase [Pseudomonadota bacterium]